MNITDFELFLRQGNLAQNTITAYLYAVKDYFAHYKELNKRNLVAYKSFLADNFKPKTVNLRILGLNKYLGYIGKSRLRLKTIKEQQRTYLENVISNADYEFLKNHLRMEKNQTWYFAVRFLAATGARISELIHLKAILQQGIMTSIPKAARCVVYTFQNCCVLKLLIGCANRGVALVMFS